MGFLRFVRAHWLASFGLFFGGVLNVWGIMSDVYGLYRLGLPSWAWQVAGVVLVVASLFALMYRFNLELAGPSRSKSGEVPLYRTLNRAIQAAQVTLAYRPTARAAEQTWPEVRAAMLSASKEAGIALPPETGDANIDLQTGLRLLERVAPLIRQGHRDEARAAAQAFIDQLK